MKQLMFVFQLALCCLFGAEAFALAAHVNLTDALARKLVRLEAVKVSNGLDLNVINLAHDSVYLNIDAGCIFPPSDGRMQPQVVTRSHEICLAEGEERRARLLTRCGNANVGAVPFGYADFMEPVMGSPEMIEMLLALEPYKLDRSFTVQNIVWHFTNGHELATFHPNGDDPTDYQTAMAVFSTNNANLIDPGYRIKYRDSNDPNDPVFSGIPEQIDGQVKVKLNSSADVVIALLDANGTIIKPLKYIGNQQPGEFALSFRGQVLDLPKGNYTVAVVDMTGNRLGALPVEI